jgi:hypothetical protein
MRKIARWYRSRDANIAEVSRELAGLRGDYSELNRLIKNAASVPGVIVTELQGLAARISAAQCELEFLVNGKIKAVDEMLVKRAHEDLQRFVSELVSAAPTNQGGNHGEEKGGEE